MGWLPPSSANASRLMPCGRCIFSFTGFGAGPSPPAPERGTPRMSLMSAMPAGAGLRSNYCYQDGSPQAPDCGMQRVALRIWLDYRVPPEGAIPLTG